jgi:hypothetical protein
LTGEYGHANFIDWLKKWDEEPGWGGFVYATATGGFERQQCHDDYAIPVTYYPAPPPAWDVLLTGQPRANFKKQVPQGPVGDADPRNRRTPNRGAFGGPVVAHLVDVEISSLEVRYTYPDPVLTPFDYMLAKCRGLSAAIVAFLAKYDDRISRDMELRRETIPGVAGQTWLQDHPFEYPLDGKAAEWCLEAVYQASVLLDSHGSIQGDERWPNPPQPFNSGYYRRRQILQRLSDPSGAKVWSFLKVAGELPAMLQDESRKYLVDPKDRSVDYLTRQYLYDVASELHRDVTRALAGCQGPGARHYNYQGPPA